jgi:agmatinase
MAAGEGFPFRSQNTFLKAPAGDGARPFAVAGLPWDGSVTNRPGARFGPDAIRRASHMLCDGTHPHFGVSPAGHLTDLGDLAFPNTSLAAMRSAVAAAIPPLLAKHHVVWLGGDHSVTLPVLRALRERLGRPVALVHFDAHCDTWPDNLGEPSGHGTWTREAIAEGLVVPQALIQLGIRSPAEREPREFVEKAGGRVFTARALRGLDGVPALSPVIDEIRRRVAAAGSPPTYLTLDIDCLDPAFAPGTGTPEPAGLASSQVMTLLEELADLPWCGMDVVEVSPPWDHAELTSNAAAAFAWTYLAGRVARTP